MANYPWFKFFPGDWMKDPELSKCSAAARGIWMDVLCLMYQSEEPGILRTGGKAWTIKEIAQAVRGNTRDNLVTLYELERNRVMSKGSDGSYFSRRLVRDEARRRADRVRQRRHRLPDVSGVRKPVTGNVTPHVTPLSQGDVRSQMSEPSNSTFSQDATRDARHGPGKKGWIDVDAERRRKNREALDAAIPESVDRATGRDVPKKGPKP
jgi:hypothetical protein